MRLYGRHELGQLRGGVRRCLLWGLEDLNGLIEGGRGFILDAQRVDLGHAGS